MNKFGLITGHPSVGFAEEEMKFAPESPAGDKGKQRFPRRSDIDQDLTDLVAIFRDRQEDRIFVDDQMIIRYETHGLAQKGIAAPIYFAGRPVVGGVAIAPFRDIRRRGRAVRVQAGRSHTATRVEAGRRNP